jgi:hypothetical protein
MRAFTLCLVMSLLAPIAPENVEGQGRRQPLDCHGRNHTGWGTIRLRGIPKVGIGHYRCPLDCIRCKYECAHCRRGFTREGLEAGFARRCGPQSIVGRSREIAKEHEVTPNAAMRSATLARGSGLGCGRRARLAVPYRRPAGAAIYVAK